MKKWFCALAILLMLALCVSALADNVLRPGDKGAAVSAAQQRLAYYMYYNGEIDGKYGDATERAVRSFQRRNDLRVDGKIGPVTLAVLNSDNAVIAPLTPDEEYDEDVVKLVQGFLASCGYYNGKIDGIYGKATAAATKAFQKANGLKADGKAGEETLSKFLDANIVHAPVSKDSNPDYSEDKIKHIQERLAYYGYYTGAVDGKFGDSTLAAVKLFQKANKLQADGIVGPKTAAKLDGNAAVSKGEYQAELDGYLRLGDLNDAVKTLQRHLKDTLYYTGGESGLFDEGVQKAVRAFQSSTGISATGVVDTNTRNALYNRTASIFKGGIPRRSLSSGDRGWDVKVLQERLAKLKYFGATVSGHYDSVTVTAVNAFQKASGITQTGSVDAVTRRYLWPGAEEADETKYPELRLEAKGDYVSKAQMRLKAAGFYSGEVDGKFGRHMRNAVKAFQKDRKLVSDGVIGPKTWAELMKINVDDVVPPSVITKDTVLRPGDRGTEVKLMQTKLVSLKYDIAVDGKYGPKTTAAVKDFQKKNKLEVDGKVGPKTMAVINKKLGL